MFFDSLGFRYTLLELVCIGSRPLLFRGGRAGKLHISLKSVKKLNIPYREHSVNIITIDGIKYMSDVGYGGDGPIMPLPLTKDTITPNIGTQEMRLLYGSMPGLVEGHANLWTFQFRNSVEKPWRSGYGFYEVEYFQRDFEIQSFYCSQNAACSLTFNLLVIRFLRHEGKVYGKVTLEQNKVKENLGRKSVLVLTCETEQERQKVLCDRFGIVFTEEERSGIVGRATALAL